MNIFKKIENELHVIVEQKKAKGFYPAELAFDRIEATLPRDASHGDIATNAALIIAPQLKKNPMDVAQDLAADISKHIANIANIDVAKPGFINLTFNPSVWQEQLPEIIAAGRGYGNSDIGAGKRINVEYVSANPTGPMHVGHGRGAVYGDALATLLIKAGYDVTKEYYINDAGSQVDKLAESAYVRYREACGETIGDIPEGLYPGDYLVPVGEALHRVHGESLMNKDREIWLPIVRDYTLDAMMEIIKGDLAAIGIYHDLFSSERAIRDAGEVDEAVRLLDNKGLIYTGVLEPPKGKPVPEDWEPRPQMLFRSTEFGDDVDRAIKKSDGSWAYITPDIAYHFDKCKRHFDTLIDVFGADHGGYVKRLKAAVEALSDGKVKLEVKLCQLVKFIKDGEPLKMSKRAGTFITVREVVEEVGKDVFRFIMLTRKNDVPIDFDFAKVTEQSKDNPVFYVQYAHARARSVIRRAQEECAEAISLLPLPLAGEGRGGGDSAAVKSPSLTLPPSGRGDILARLAHPEELKLIRLLSAWPRMVESAANAFEPHRIAFYLQDVAAAFHGLWNLGNDDLGLRFIVKSDIELTAARLALTRAVTCVIASGLMVMGVEPVEEMR